jgi:hypothetical protein
VREQLRNFRDPDDRFGLVIPQVEFNLFFFVSFSPSVSEESNNFELGEQEIRDDVSFVFPPDDEMFNPRKRSHSTNKWK